MPQSYITFAYPWCLAIPPLWLAVMLVHKISRKSVDYPSLEILKSVPKSIKVTLRSPVLFLLGAIAVCAFAISGARPQRVSALSQEKEARNIMLAIDISRSMAAQDFESAAGTISRLAGVKEVVSEFIANRVDDRIGLVVFGSTAYLQVPLTRDHVLLEQMIERLDVGLAGDGTAIGDGLGLSIKRIEGLNGSSKAIVLLTDGVNNSGQVVPIQAAKVAAQLGIKVHTVGLGSDTPLAYSGGGGLFGQLPNRVEFDQETLKEIATVTGGVYFNATDLDGLKEVYRKIDQLEQTNEPDSTQQIEELFYPWTVLGFACLLLYYLLNQSIFMLIP